MSLSLIQGYSSGEDEPQQPHIHDSDTEEEDDADTAEPSSTSHPSLGDRSIFDHLPPPPSASGLPSAFDAFSEVISFTPAIEICFKILNFEMLLLPVIKPLGCVFP